MKDFMKIAGIALITAAVLGFGLYMLVMFSMGIAHAGNSTPEPEPTPHIVTIEYVVRNWKGPRNVLITYTDPNGEDIEMQRYASHNSELRFEFEFQAGSDVGVKIYALEDVSLTCVILNKITGETIDAVTDFEGYARCNGIAQ